MPWKPSQAKEHSKKADTPGKQRKWAEVANAVLKQVGDEGKAIRIANAKIGQQRRTPHNKRGGNRG